MKEHNKKMVSLPFHDLLHLQDHLSNISDKLLSSLSRTPTSIKSANHTNQSLIPQPHILFLHRERKLNRQSELDY